MVSWQNDAPVSCWKPKGKTLPFLKAEAGNLVGVVQPPSLKVSGFAPFPRPALSFKTTGANAATESAALSFPASASPLFTQNSARFLAVVFAPADTNSNQPIVSVDASNYIAISPSASEVRIASGSRLGLATNVPLSLNTVTILAVSDSGSETSVKYWNSNSNSVVSVPVQVSSNSVTANNVFNWQLTGMHLGGRLESGANVFSGGVAEIMLYGSLTGDEERRVMCYLASRHAGFTSSCL